MLLAAIVWGLAGILVGASVVIIIDLFIWRNQ